MFAPAFPSFSGYRYPSQDPITRDVKLWFQVITSAEAWVYLKFLLKGENVGQGFSIYNVASHRRPKWAEVKEHIGVSFVKLQNRSIYTLHYTSLSCPVRPDIQSPRLKG